MLKYLIVILLCISCFWPGIYYYSAGSIVETASETPKAKPKVDSAKAESQAVIKIVTAYSPKEGCDDPECIMASGKRVYEGAVACSRAIPLGTKIKVAGKIYTCEDRLAKRFDDRVDIFFEDYNEALRFGRQYLPVAVIK